MYIYTCLFFTFNLLSCVSIFNSLKKQYVDFFADEIKYIGKDDWLGIELDNDNNYFTTKEGLWLVYHKENNCQTTGEFSHNKEVLFEVSDCVLLKDKTIGQSQLFF
ncbi:hypothetical protein RFI_34107 [Reticulomyxa filosa]|uniref:Uncharacterized protein n=1 Tax=Reticulomyxa filosa TaxID=46433 RepID=X6LQ86_RETFI|nr:hypothetical protein RFI_34107 [Reticulomyxa filosa]|eukprot:ETO03302.1 hypothetical protein RFI_34107 [Reticulomyxa filosa]